MGKQELDKNKEFPQDGRGEHQGRGVITIKPFVKPGETLGFAQDLKDRGLWPPKNHAPGEGNHDRDKKTFTPYLIIPSMTGDTGMRPLPASPAHHSTGIWLENAAGNPVSDPAIGQSYKIKSRVINIGSNNCYAGLIDFMLTPLPSTSPLTVRSLGHSGFTLKAGEAKILECSNLWTPASAADLASGIIVQAYDIFMDNINIRYDSVNDRHVARHDFTSDFYVRDWTSSSASHDDGSQPSSQVVIWETSDIWNRRSNNPGVFVNDVPENENPQAGNGSAGDNFAFARISRKGTATQEKVFAHFMYAEFGTGSPFLNCSPAADSSVTFMPGESVKIISMPWNLHPSSSTHLCMSVQIYSDADPYQLPGLLGNTPGAATDTIVRRDNNKAQRNMSVWDHVPGTAAMHVGKVGNGSSGLRDVHLRLDASDGSVAMFKNAMISVTGTDMQTPFRAGEIITLKNMLPGESRWLSFSFDAFNAREGEQANIHFHELNGDEVASGFGFTIRGASQKVAMDGLLRETNSVLTRMRDGFQVKAVAGADLVLKSMANFDQPSFVRGISGISNVFDAAKSEISLHMNGIKDTSGLSATLTRFNTFFVSTKAQTSTIKKAFTSPLGGISKSVTEPRVSSVDALKTVTAGAAHDIAGRINPRVMDPGMLSGMLSMHFSMLQQMDIYLTDALKSQGDEALINLTAMVQRDLIRESRLSSIGNLDVLLNATLAFMKDFSSGITTAQSYPMLVRTTLPSLTSITESVNQGPVSAAMKTLLGAVGNGNPAALQKAHLAWLNTLVQVFNFRKDS